MLRRLTDDLTLDVVGSSASITLCAGDNIKFVHADVYKASNGTHVRVQDDDLKLTIVADAIESKQESRRRVIEILESRVLFDSLPEIRSTAEKHIRDLGHELKWPYMHDVAWLHKLNAQLKHPSVTIETLKMSDGWHLAIVLNTAW
jgi:hypothetical protein